MADQRSAPATAWRRIYATRQWRALRDWKRQANPLCEMCARQGRLTVMRSVDHIIPHRGDLTLAFSPTNLQSLCAPHHDSTKQGDEKRGYSGSCDARGWPTDPAHPAHRP